VVHEVTEVVKKPLAMNLVIQNSDNQAAAVMIIFCEVSPQETVRGAVWQSGMLLLLPSMVLLGWLVLTLPGQ